MAAWSLTLYRELCVLSLITDETHDSNGVLARRIFFPRRELIVNHEGSVGGSQSSERFSKTGRHRPFGKGLTAVAINCKALFFGFFLFFLLFLLCLENAIVTNRLMRAQELQTPKTCDSVVRAPAQIFLTTSSSLWLSPLAGQRNTWYSLQKYLPHVYTS